MKVVLSAIILLGGFLAPVGAQDLYMPPLSTPEVLVADLPSTQTWTAVRSRMLEHSARLRIGLRNGPGSFQTVRKEFETDLQRLLDVAMTISPEQAPAFAGAINELRGILETIDENRTAEGARRISLLGKPLLEMEAALLRLEEIARESDQQVGRSPVSFNPFPDDWTPPRHGDNGMRPIMAIKTAGELIDETRTARDRLFHASSAVAREEGEELARQMVEAARALVWRQGEVGYLARTGFRNAALRLEVLSENLVDLLEDRDRANFRRQLYSIGRTLDQLQGDLDRR